LIGEQDFFDKNENLKRPLSEHVTIWKWQLPPILSTLHRGTGAALALLFSSSGVVFGYGQFLDFHVIDAVNLIKV
jgi:succinate dehydrogenase/fumarate reductase cytochrome b subunit